jgi:SAM-dependent methyltransferase
VDGDAEYSIGKVSVRLVSGGLEKRCFGKVVFPDAKPGAAPRNIYGSGPPVLEPGNEILRLYPRLSLGWKLGPRCRMRGGAYASGLVAAGHQWTGLELNPHSLQLLQERGLPFRRITPSAQAFPCGNEEFDEVICIEVLEHIEDPKSFLQEVSRVVRKRTLFSVPNIEVIPYFKDWEAVPWHLLEGDHKNFFTRASLRELLAPHFSRVEVFSYIEHPLRTRDGIALHAHLFAVADKAV